MYKVHNIGYKWTLNGVDFSCSNAWLKHNELCSLSLCPVTALTHVYQTALSHIPAGKTSLQ